MGEFSISHVLIIAVVLLIFFGPSRLPGLGQALGKAIRGFKEGINDVTQPPPPRESGTNPNDRIASRPNDSLESAPGTDSAVITDKTKPSNKV